MRNQNNIKTLPVWRALVDRESNENVERREKTGELVFYNSNFSYFILFNHITDLSTDWRPIVFVIFFLQVDKIAKEQETLDEIKEIESLLTGNTILWFHSHRQLLHTVSY